MKGLELCKKYFEEVGKPAFEANCPEVLKRAAIGLVGEGSECMGFDDDISKDHDWGPGFCVWLSADDYAEFGQKAKAVYASLPAEYMGYERLRQSEYTVGRVGILQTGAFYAQYLGIPQAPRNNTEWRFVSVNGLATLSDGEVWSDPLGEFSEIRRKIQGFYPEDVRKKKLAKHAAIAAQAGQYNYYRCRNRGEYVAAAQALADFIENIQHVVFLLNLRYKPYYKWAHHAMKQLPILGSEIASMIEDLVKDDKDKSGDIEPICARIIQEFKAQGLSDSQSDFMLHHAEQIQASIKDPAIRGVHIMSD